MWLNETLASGMTPYYHFVGAEKGFGEDRRWQKVGEDYFAWTAKHDAHLTVRRSIANIGVVMGQSTQLFILARPRRGSRSYMHETTQGMYDALLRGRYAFDYVHEDRMEPEHLSKYRALLLPNIAMLSDQQCEQLRAYVQAGGSLMASFETSLYDENLKPRADFGLAILFGVSQGWRRRSGPMGILTTRALQSPQSATSAARRILRYQLAGRGAKSCAAQSDRQSAADCRAGLCALSTGACLSAGSDTDEPAVVLREKGTSRLAWFAGDVERTYWLTGHARPAAPDRQYDSLGDARRAHGERGGAGLC